MIQHVLLPCLLLTLAFLVFIFISLRHGHRYLTISQPARVHYIRLVVMHTHHLVVVLLYYT